MSSDEPVQRAVAAAGLLHGGPIGAAMQQHIALYRCIVTVCEPLQGQPATRSA